MNRHQVKYYQLCHVQLLEGRFTCLGSFPGTLKTHTLDQHHHSLKNHLQAPLVAQWLRIHLPKKKKRIHLPVQRIQLWSLTQEDPTSRGATKPTHHNYWACAPEPGSHGYWAHMLQLRKPTHPRAHAPQESSPRSHIRESPGATTKTQCGLN